MCNSPVAILNHYPGPVALYQYRLLAPASRHIQYRAAPGVYEVSVSTRGDTQELVIRRRNAPQFQYDPYAPLSSYLDDQIEISEFQSWAEVAQWADTLFSSSGQDANEVQARARELRAPSGDIEETVRRVLDFVQKEVRYFGTEMGENSHLPQPPAKVLRQRYGDCKDKAALMVALLKDLGITATPVLVSTDFRDATASFLPTPLAFNHAIVGVTLGGRTIYLDGTREHQSGRLSARQTTGLGKGLLARSGESGLSDLPDAMDELRVQETDTFHIQQFSADPSLEVRVTYFGDLAENIRAVSAGDSASQFESDFVGDYRRLYPTLQQDGALQKLEDSENNALTLVAHFKLADYWRFPREQALVGDYAMAALIQPLRLASQAPRSKPWRLFFPGIYRDTVAYEFDEDVYASPASAQVDDQAVPFSLHVQREVSTREVKTEGELRLFKDRIEAEDWNTYRDQLNKVWPHLAGAMVVPSVSPSAAERGKRDYQDLVDDLRKGRVKVATQVQAVARVRLLALNLQLDGGRLSPKLRAQALVARGVELDNLGRWEDAKTDFLNAIALNPQSAQAHAALAVNALSRRQDDMVDQEAARALQLAPADMATRYIQVYADFCRGSYDKARDELQSILKSSSERERSYGALWLYMTARHTGANGEPAVRPFLPTGLHPEWPYPVLQMFLGAQTFEQAAAQAKENGRPDPSKLCELYFYAAEKSLLDGDARQAQEYFQKSVDTGVTEYVEYGLSERELALLSRR